VVYLNDFEGQGLLRRSAPRNDIVLCHCERSEAISALFFDDSEIASSPAAPRNDNP
jgi:hypothetical protein